MKLTLALAGLGAAALCCAAAPVPDSANLQEAFTGTVTSTYPDGRQGRLWLNPDGSYRAEGRRHDPSSGHWKIKGDKICLYQARPIGLPFMHYCTSAPSSGRTTWQGKAPTGEPITIRIVPGRSA